MHGDFHTVGDIAYRDEEGYYYICDRKNDMIISGGMNVYPPRSRPPWNSIRASSTSRSSASPPSNGASRCTPPWYARQERRCRRPT